MMLVHDTGTISSCPTGSARRTTTRHDPGCSFIAPVTVTRNGDKVTKEKATDVLDYVVEDAKKDFTITRFKGLGEMNAEQLWDTTMNADTRTLLQVKLEDAVAAEDIFTTLMGENVEARRKFIEDNALEVVDLDI